MKNDKKKKNLQTKFYACKIKYVSLLVSDLNSGVCMQLYDFYMHQNFKYLRKQCKQKKKF